jgi:hypothetical protein
MHRSKAGKRTKTRILNDKKTQVNLIAVKLAWLIRTLGELFFVSLSEVSSLVSVGLVNNEKNSPGLLPVHSIAP